MVVVDLVARELNKSRAVGFDRAELEVAEVDVPGEIDALAVGRPGGVGVVRGRGQLLNLGAVGLHRVQDPVAHERDPLAIGRPGGLDVVGPVALGQILVAVSGVADLGDVVVEASALEDLVGELQSGGGPRRMASAERGDLLVFSGQIAGGADLKAPHRLVAGREWPVRIGDRRAVRDRLRQACLAQLPERRLLLHHEGVDARTAGDSFGRRTGNEPVPATAAFQSVVADSSDERVPVDTPGKSVVARVPEEHIPPVAANDAVLADPADQDVAPPTTDQPVVATQPVDHGVLPAADLEHVVAIRADDQARPAQRNARGTVGHEPRLHLRVGVERQGATGRGPTAPPLPAGEVKPRVRGACERDLRSNPQGLAAVAAAVDPGGRARDDAAAVHTHLEALAARWRSGGTKLRRDSPVRGHGHRAWPGT